MSVQVQIAENKSGLVSICAVNFKPILPSQFMANPKTKTGLRLWAP
ncbi:MAG: hypothetical protein QW699_04950 [Metallosphaera sp.]